MGDYYFNRAALRNILFKRNMQQKELAEKLGITPTTVSKYIVGKAEPNLEMQKRICKVLDVPFETLTLDPLYLIGNDDAEEENKKLFSPGNILLPADLTTRADCVMKVAACIGKDESHKLAFQYFAGSIIQNVLDSDNPYLPPETKKAVADIIETTFKSFIDLAEKKNTQGQK